MSSSGPSTGPVTKRPPGNAARILLPIIGIPLVGMLAWNYVARGNGIKTPGVANIEKAYSAGGAKSTHTPGYGGTPRGKSGDESLNGNPNEQVGGQETFQSGLRNRDGESVGGDEMRTRGKQSTVVGKAINHAVYGSTDGK